MPMPIKTARIGEKRDTIDQLRPPFRPAALRHGGGKLSGWTATRLPLPLPPLLQCKRREETCVACPGIPRGIFDISALQMPILRHIAPRPQCHRSSLRPFAATNDRPQASLSWPPLASPHNESNWTSTIQIGAGLGRASWVEHDSSRECGDPRVGGLVSVQDYLVRQNTSYHLGRTISSSPPSRRCIITCHLVPSHTASWRRRLLYWYSCARRWTDPDAPLPSAVPPARQASLFYRPTTHQPPYAGDQHNLFYLRPIEAYLALCRHKPWL
jgi:hypothetical protein